MLNLSSSSGGGGTVDMVNPLSASDGAVVTVKPPDSTGGLEMTPMSAGADKASLLPQPMEGAIAVVNETVAAINSEYNFGKDVGKEILTYSRPAVERYIFSKLYDNLFAMYAIKN